MCQSSWTAGPHPQCRTRPSRSSQTRGTPRRSASRRSALPHCTPCGGSGTSGLSPSWAAARPWPRAWWGHPEKWGADREPRVKLGVTSTLGIPPDLPIPQMAAFLLRRARASRIQWLGALATIFPQEQAVAIGKAIQTLPGLHPLNP